MLDFVRTAVVWCRLLLITLSICAVCVYVIGFFATIVDSIAL